MYCIKCGCVVGENSLYCTKCGNDLTASRDFCNAVATNGVNGIINGSSGHWLLIVMLEILAMFAVVAPILFKNIIVTILCVAYLLGMLIFSRFRQPEHELLMCCKDCVTKDLQQRNEVVNERLLRKAGAFYKNVNILKACVLFSMFAVGIIIVGIVTGYYFAAVAALIYLAFAHSEFRRTRKPKNQQAIYCVRCGQEIDYSEARILGSDKKAQLKDAVTKLKTLAVINWLIAFWFVYDCEWRRFDLVVGLMFLVFGWGIYRKYQAALFLSLLTFIVLLAALTAATSGLIWGRITLILVIAYCYYMGIKASLLYGRLTKDIKQQKASIEEQSDSNQTPRCKNDFDISAADELDKFSEKNNRAELKAIGKSLLFIVVFIAVSLVVNLLFSLFGLKKVSFDVLKFSKASVEYLALFRMLGENWFAIAGGFICVMWFEYRQNGSPSYVFFDNKRAWRILLIYTLTGVAVYVLGFLGRLVFVSGTHLPDYSGVNFWKYFSLSFIYYLSASILVGIGIFSFTANTLQKCFSKYGAAFIVASFFIILNVCFSDYYTVLDWIDQYLFMMFIALAVFEIKHVAAAIGIAFGWNFAQALAILDRTQTKVYFLNLSGWRSDLVMVASVVIVYMVWDRYISRDAKGRDEM